ncbi:long-chain-fatty-acid--CoA ligase [Brevundimonas abyssalis TAR-001]|uniref:3-methylmercaptopropionyl-CoA ligase n=1 Tax=Brevundimonas abyssalis TAR-001 TaxID=1391729 RepID=A0A8E0NBQ5_9CAUL|nr:long-chain-fatty-acid--CoA ligase [Brevundimonas abyssalis TAR-001]
MFQDKTTSYRALAEIGANVGAALIATGLSANDHVGLLAKNTDAYFELLAGCSQARCVLTPVNWRLAPDEVCFILKDAEVKVLFTSAEYLEIAIGLAAEIGIKRVILLDGEPPEGVEAYLSWRETGTDVSLATPNADDVLLQIYSSGTTGSPKGVELTHANFLAAADQIRYGMVGRWEPEDRLLIALPLFHAGALLTASYALLAGAKCVVLRDASIDVLLETAERHQVTKVGFVPALIQLLIDHPEFRADRFSHLDTVIYGGSAITPTLLQRALAVLPGEFVQLFGSSETMTAGTVLTGADHLIAERVVTCGRAMQGIDIRIIRADGSDADTDEPGEILVRSATVMKGYWRRPEQTREVIVDGWYHTGDVGSLDAHGYLTIRDRVRDLVISGGENIYPVEIENVLIQHPEVADCAVIGVPDTRWGEAVKAIVVPAPGVEPGGDRLIAYLQERIARYKCPRSVAFIEALPRNATGKVLKRVLRETYSE